MHSTNSPDGQEVLENPLHYISAVGSEPVKGGRMFTLITKPKDGSLGLNALEGLAVLHAAIEYLKQKCPKATFIIYPGSVCEDRVSFTTDPQQIKWREILGHLQLKAVENGLPKDNSQLLSLVDMVNVDEKIDVDGKPEVIITATLHKDALCGTPVMNAKMLQKVATAIQSWLLSEDMNVKTIVNQDEIHIYDPDGQYIENAGEIAEKLMDRIQQLGNAVPEIFPKGH